MGMMGFGTYIGGTELPVKKVGLIQGRHPLPVEGYIIQGDIPPEKMNKPGILSLVDLSLCKGEETVALYITGLTIAALTVVDVLRSCGIGVEIWNFDPQTGKYYSQGFFQATGTMTWDSTCSENLSPEWVAAVRQLIDPPHVEGIEERLVRLGSPTLSCGTIWSTGDERVAMEKDFMGYLATLSDEEISSKIRPAMTLSGTELRDVDFMS